MTKQRKKLISRFLLRQFFRNGMRANGYQMSNGKKFERLAVQETLYSKYFSDDDPIKEKAFSIIVEGVIRVLNNISNMDLHSVSEGDLLLLQQLVYLQGSGLAGATESIESLILALLGSVRNSLLNNTHSTEAKSDAFGDKSTDVLLAASALPYIMELELKLLVAPKGVPLVISNNPVAYYNQFARQYPLSSKFATLAGCFLKGTQAFLPLSSNVCIGVYDNRTYRYGDEEKGILIQMTESDVISLNIIQAVNSRRCLYWHPFSEPTIEHLNRVMATADRSIDRKTNIPPVLSSSQVDAKFSFVQVKDRTPYLGARYLFPR